MIIKGMLIHSYCIHELICNQISWIWVKLNLISDPNVWPVFFKAEQNLYEAFKDLNWPSDSFQMQLY